MYGLFRVFISVGQVQPPFGFYLDQASSIALMKKLYMHKSPALRLELVGIRVSNDEDPKGY